MKDYKGVEICIIQYTKPKDVLDATGGKPQEPAEKVMETLNLVG